MKLKTAHIRNYRSVRDTGVFDVEAAKTILVGPNEAGKTAVLQALQQINPPKGVKSFDALRDYPRAKYNDITAGKVDPEKVPVATVTFTLDEEDLTALPASMRGITGYTFTRYIANNASHALIGAPALPTVGSIRKNAVRLAAHVDSRTPVAEGAAASTAQTDRLNALLKDWRDELVMPTALSVALKDWVDALVAHADDSEDTRIDRLRAAFSIAADRDAALKALDKRIPVFVLFSNYFRVRPLIHLGHLADRLKSNTLDDEQYDYGNKCHWSGSGRVRHPVFLGLREDKRAAEVVRDIADPEANRIELRPRASPKAGAERHRGCQVAVPPLPKERPEPRKPAKNFAMIVEARPPRRATTNIGGVDLTHADRQLWRGITKENLPNIGRRLPRSRCPDSRTDRLRSSAARAGSEERGAAPNIDCRG